MTAPKGIFGGEAVCSRRRVTVETEGNQGQGRQRGPARSKDRDPEASLCTIVKVQNVYASSIPQLMKDCGVLGYEWTDDATVHSMSSQSRCNPQFHQVPAPSLLHLKQPTCRWGSPYNLQATCYHLRYRRFLHEATV